jgi:hypothetical protein
VKQSCCHRDASPQLSESSPIFEAVPVHQSIAGGIRLYCVEVSKEKLELIEKSELRGVESMDDSIS